MKKSKIRDVKTLITKGTTPMTLGGSFTESGINFLKVENVDGSIFLDPRKFYHINSATHQKMKRSNVLEGD